MNMIMMATEETTEKEEATPEKKEDCIVIPGNMKPLFECCKDYSEGKIDSSDFFAKMLVRTGEFMQKVNEKRA